MEVKEAKCIKSARKIPRFLSLLRKGDLETGLRKHLLSGTVFRCLIV